MSSSSSSAAARGVATSKFWKKRGMPKKGQNFEVEIRHPYYLIFDFAPYLSRIIKISKTAKTTLYRRENDHHRHLRMGK